MEKVTEMTLKKRGRRERFTVEQVAAALRSSGGIVTTAAGQLGVSHGAVFGYLKRHPELEEVRQEAIEATLDVAEGELLQQIKNGNLTAIIFFLKCKGKGRGYIERQQIEQTGGGKLTVQEMREIMDRADRYARLGTR